MTQPIEVKNVTRKFQPIWTRTPTGEPIVKYIAPSGSVWLNADDAQRAIDGGRFEYTQSFTQSRLDARGVQL